MNLTKDAIRIYVWDYVFLGSNFLFASYFQSIEFAKSATVINILRTIIILIPVAFLISLLLPDTFIWAIIMASEMITSIVILTSFHKDIFRKGASNNFEYVCTKYQFSIILFGVGSVLFVDE